MKCNVRELAYLCDYPCVVEGRLNYKKISNNSYLTQHVFKERWFRLINNYLFYFKINDMGNFDTKNPAGVFVMENASIQMEHGQSISFAFSISFIDESEKRHMFTARTEENVVLWVMKLRTCSYEYLRERLHTLQSKIYSMTGKDPLLLIPRNDGAKLWAPTVPFSTTADPVCTGANSFSCHLHHNGLFSLERSKSDIQTRHLKHHKTVFYTDNNKVTEKKEKVKGCALERSKTSVLPYNNVDQSIFDNRPLYSRAAPSPPVRMKLSPNPRRAELSSDTKVFAETSKNLAQSGILDPVPIPPRRKVSPRTLGLPDTNNLNVNSETSKSSNELDLIQF